MAIKFLKKHKDLLQRKIFYNQEKKKNYLKYLILRYTRLIRLGNQKEKQKAIYFIDMCLQKMQSLTKTKINNYCILTGRKKGVYRDFKLSRHQIRGNFKFLTGLRNSSF